MKKKRDRKTEEQKNEDPKKVDEGKEEKSPAKRLVIRTGVRGGGPRHDIIMQ